MIGIETIGSYIPTQRISNYDRKEKLGLDDLFIEHKIGIQQIAIKAADEDTSDLCVRAYEQLCLQHSFLGDEVEVLVVVTQNPDTNLPHTSAIVHGKLGLPETCACFDISLGCSGFVYGLSIVQAFMQANGFRCGLLFTADPYSKIVDPIDKSTASLFGDAATITLISDSPLYVTSQFTFGTIGKQCNDLLCRNGVLFMNGRAIFNFAARYVPADVKHLLDNEGLSLNSIDRFVFHQGSKYVLDTITKRLKADKDKVVFDATHYGNVVSSSIPIILGKEFEDSKNEQILISGFGVGLSWASTILKRI